MGKPIMARSFLILALCCAVVGNTWAEEVHYNRISLSVSSKGELANDTLSVTLYAHAQEKDTAAAARIVNDAMQWALKKADQEDSIKSQTLGYRTQPVYRDQRIVAWKAEQKLQLESQNIEALASLTGRLQEKLSVNEMDYQASENLRTNKENDLIVEALASFENRARIIARSLNAEAYKITNINISTNQPPPYQRMETMRGASMMAKVAPAAVELGTQTVTVMLNGEIELQK